MKKAGLSVLMACLLLGLWFTIGRSTSVTGHRPEQWSPANTAPLNVAVMGTSLSANSSWPESLTEKLSECLVRDVQLFRFASAGANSNWGVFQVDAVKNVSPHVVLIEFAINDADILDGTGLSRSRQNHTNMIDSLLQDGAEPLVVLLSVSPARGLRSITRPTIARYYTAYRDLAARDRVAMADLAPLWQEIVERRDLAELIPDGIHPAEPEGGSVVSTLLFDLLMDWSDEKCRPNPSH
ncbi:MAG: SGNH/GDSL hydrolase family protein [Paracoccaceae bacterium]|nr:SGNH/GDSL hydrolase family protein [Paracoccaceae bacterium]